MTSLSTSSTPWEEDPDGASILLATGRGRHDLLIVAEPALLAELDLDWGQPQASLPLSFLPGVSAPGDSQLEDELRSYDRDGVGVLVARGHTRLFEGQPANRVTALARIAAGAGVRKALLVTRATALTDAPLGAFLPVSDHLNCSGMPLFNATSLTESQWDEPLAELLSALPGVLDPVVAALIPGPVRPTRAEATWLSNAGAQIALTDTVAEAVALSSRGVRVGALALVDACTGKPQTEVSQETVAPAQVVAQAAQMLVESLTA